MPKTEDAPHDATYGLNELPDFRDLPDSVQNDLKAICRQRIYTTGQTITEIGMRPETIDIVLDGILRIQKPLPDGREHVFGLLVAGDMLGRLFNASMHLSVEAATDAEVFAFERTGFEALLLQAPELGRLLLLNLMNEMDRA